MGLSTCRDVSRWRFATKSEKGESLKFQTYRLTERGIGRQRQSWKLGYIQRLDVESFPDEDFLSLSLNSLQIGNSPDPKKLDYKGLCQLSSLKGWLFITATTFNVYFWSKKNHKFQIVDAPILISLTLHQVPILHNIYALLEIQSCLLQIFHSLISI